MNIPLSDHFTYNKLLRFTLPSIVMMVFTSIYGVVDGIFVSNCVGTDAFAALNFIMPVCMIPGAIGFMLGTGGSALVARLMGEGKQDKANRVFSMLIYVLIAAGTLISTTAILFLEPIARLMGAEGQMLADCVTYGRVLLLGTVPFVLQNAFQSFLVVAAKPQFGLAITVIAGVTNMVLDAVLVWLVPLGLTGAAAATAFSQLVGCVIPLLYFFRPKDSSLRLTRCKFDRHSLLKACTNGSSEMMTNLSLSSVNILYNVQLMSLAKENGVSAYGAIMYVNFIFISMFIGYSIGSAPLISFHYGAENDAELQNLRQKSRNLIAIGALSMSALSFMLATPLAAIFSGGNQALFEMTEHAFRIYSLSYLFAGFNIFGSAFFTALNNGAVSALISFLRSLVFQVIAVTTLPLIFGLDGVWWSINVAEGIAVIVTLSMVIVHRKRYRY